MMQVAAREWRVRSPQRRISRRHTFVWIASQLSVVGGALSLTVGFMLVGGEGSKLKAATLDHLASQHMALMYSDSLEVPHTHTPPGRFDPTPVTPPKHYAVSLSRTSQTSGLGRASGVAEVYFPESPFGVRLTDNGSYHYQVRLTVQGLPAREGSEYVAWVTTPTLDRIDRLGVLPESGLLEGEIQWNKFLVVITLESERAGVNQTAGWEGPIVLRGMSRSGKMHPMEGHDPFVDREGCAQYGFDAVHCR